VGTGIVRLESRRSDPYSTCCRSHFHNYLAAENGVQALLTVPALDDNITWIFRMTELGSWFTATTYEIMANNGEKGWRAK
jgi:hypothetical protein